MDRVIIAYGWQWYYDGEEGNILLYGIYTTYEEVWCHLKVNLD